MNEHLTSQSGASIFKRAWVTIPLRDGDMVTGRFSGVYENSTLGWMFYLSFARKHSNPEEKDTHWFVYPNCADIVAGAFEVSGPLRPGKKAPAPVGVVRH